MTKRRFGPLARLSLALCSFACAATIAAAQSGSPTAPGKVAPEAYHNDQRSGAALNRAAALRASRLGLLKPAKPGSAEFILGGTVNNPAADTTARDTQSETTVIDLGGGRLVAAWNDSGSFDGTFGGGNDHFTGFAYSSNNGATWTDGGTLPNSTEGDAGDPVLAHHAATGAVYLATLGFATGENIQVFKSTDFGHTFGAPVNGTPGYATTGDFQDKEWITVDNFAGTGNGNVYLCWTRFLNAGGAQIRFTRSTDNGASFGPSGGTLLSTGGQGCFVTVSPNHLVSVFFFRQDTGDNKLFVRRSTDRGVTFQPEVMVADLTTTTTNGSLTLNGGLRSNSFPHVAVNPVTGRQFMYVVYNDGPVGDSDIWITRSVNNGVTWTAPVRVNDDTAGDQFFPTIAFVDGGETFMVTYYSRSHDPDNLMFHRRGRVAKLLSGSGGNFVFTPSFQLSPNSPVVIGQDPAINATYMGDYDGAAGGAGAIRTTWSDNRKGNSFHTNQPDVRFAGIAIPQNAVDLGLDIVAAPTTVPLGETTVFTITATAVSGAPRDVFVHVTMPAGLKSKGVTTPDGGTCNNYNGSIDCSMGTLAAGTSKRIKIVATPIYNAGMRTLTATATTSSKDTALANNTDSRTITVTNTGTVTTTLSSGNIATAIPDSGTVEVPLVMATAGRAVQAVAKVRLNHTFDADLDIFLVSPSGQVVALSTDNGGSGDNYGSGNNDCTGTPTSFNDLAGTSIVAGTAPFASGFKPEQQIANVLGGPVNGTWKLRVTDDAGGDTGTIGCFELILKYQP